MFRKKKVSVAKLELVVLGESWDLLAYVKRIRTANHVLRELRHELGNMDGTIIDLDNPVRVHDLDGTKPRLRLQVEARHVVAQQVKPTWNGM